MLAAWTTPARFIAWLERAGGAVHTSVARRAGYGPGLIARAVEQGLVQRIRRSWIVGMDADHPTIASLRAGGRITCVSALARIGIWVPPGASADPRVHVAVAGNASRFDSAGLRVHWGKGPAPIALRAVVEHPLNVLFHVSECLELTPALAVWDSAANKSVVSAAALARVEWRGRRAQELARATSVLSDSGLETHAAVGFRALGLGVRQQVWIGGQPVDLLIGDRLVVQVDGAHHLDKTQRRRDISHDAKLRLMGYTVFRFDYQQVLFDWPLVESTVTMAVAQGLHRSDGR